MSDDQRTSDNPLPEDDRITILREMVDVAKKSSEYAMECYDNSIKRLQSLLSICGVMLTLLITSLIGNWPHHIVILLIIAALMIGISLIICCKGLYEKRMVHTTIDLGEFVSEAGYNLRASLTYEYQENRKIERDHNDANNNVWLYIRAACTTLILSVVVIIFALCQYFYFSIREQQSNDYLPHCQKQLRPSLILLYPFLTD